MAKVDATAERAGKLVEVLRQQRDQGDASYPLTVARLKELAVPEASDEEVLKALAKKPFATQVVLANRKEVSSPIALAEDVDGLARSPLLLTYALGKLCSAEKPLQWPGKVVGVIEKGLRPAFETALNTKIEASELPPGVGLHQTRGKVQLYLPQFPPPKSPAGQLADQLLATLRAERQHGDSAYPATLARLVQTAAPEAGGLVKKALADAEFRTHTVTVPVSKTETLVALAEDKAVLAGSLRLLEGLLKAATSAKKPYITPAKLGELVPEELRPLFAEATARRMQARDLGELIDVRTALSGEVELLLKENTPDHEALANKLLHMLEQLRHALKDEGGRMKDESEGLSSSSSFILPPSSFRSYPPTLDELLHHAAPQAAPALVERVFKDKGFRARVVQALPGNPDTPVALASDLDRFASSARTLEFAVGLASTAEQPLQPVPRVVGKLDKAVREAMTRAIERRAETGDWPESVAAHTQKGKLTLRLSRYALPRDPAETLADRLVEALRRYKQQGDYPVQLGTLLGPFAIGDVDDRLVRDTLNRETFTSQVASVLPGNREALVALSEDADQLLGARTLVQTLGIMGTVDNQAHPLSDLAKKVHKDLQEAFMASAQRQADAGMLPDGVGSVRIKGKVYLFLLDDVNAPLMVRAEVKTEEGSPEGRGERSELTPRERDGTDDFARLFDEAYARLEQEKAGPVSLEELRQAVPVERDVFDAEVDRLRQTGRYRFTGTAQDAPGPEGRGERSELTPRDRGEEPAEGSDAGGAGPLYVSRVV